jgi:hypothetical protein
LTTRAQPGKKQQEKIAKSSANVDLHDPARANARNNVSWQAADARRRRTPRRHAGRVHSLAQAQAQRARAAKKRALRIPMVDFERDNRFLKGKGFKGKIFESEKPEFLSSKEQKTRF